MRTDACHCALRCGTALDVHRHAQIDAWHHITHPHTDDQLPTLAGAVALARVVVVGWTSHTCRADRQQRCGAEPGLRIACGGVGIALAQRRARHTHAQIRACNRSIH